MTGLATLTHMNMRRGLFRLWIIASAAWLVFVSIVFWRDITLLIAGPDPQLIRTIEPGHFVFRIYNREYEMEAASAEDAMAAISSGKNTAQAFGNLHPDMIVVFGFVPPALLLALGSGIVWAFSGFSRSPSRQPD